MLVAFACSAADVSFPEAENPFCCDFRVLLTDFVLVASDFEAQIDRFWEMGRHIGSPSQSIEPTISTPPSKFVSTVDRFWRTQTLVIDSTRSLC